MKALLAMAMVGALVAGALLWPVGGRSFWQRAEDRGLPQATARLAARGLRSAWDLVFRAGPGTPSAPAHPPPPLRRGPRKTEPLRTATAAAVSDRVQVRATGLAAGPDRILMQPAKESLKQDDRKGLEQLLRAR